MKDKWLAWCERRLRKLYGNFEPWQFACYRCVGCRNLFVWKQIRKGKVCECGERKLRPAPNVKWWQVFRLLFLPWSFR